MHLLIAILANAHIFRAIYAFVTAGTASIANGVRAAIVDAVDEPAVQNLVRRASFTLMLTTNRSMMLTRMAALRQIVRTNATGLLLLLLLLTPRCANIVLGAERSLRLRVLALEAVAVLSGSTHTVAVKRKRVASTILRGGHGYKVEYSQIIARLIEW